MRRMSALVKKSIADVTRRKGRGLLVICGIMIGIFGLTSVNSATSMIGNAFSYTQDLSTVPDLAYSATQAVPSSVITKLKNNPNIQILQTYTKYLTTWQTQVSRQVPLQINGYDDFQQIKLGTIQLTSGRLPGPHEIVMDSRDQVFQPVAIGDTVTIEAANGSVTLRVVGLARMAGSAAENQGSTSQTLGYMRTNDLLQFTGPFSPGSFDKTKPRLDTMILMKTRQSSNIQQTAHEVEQVLQTARISLDGAAINDTHSTDQRTVSGMLTVIRILSLVALLLTCLLIINTVAILLNEQVKIVGTMKAIGGTRKTIIRSYLITVSIYAVLGTLLGLGLGIAGGYLLASSIASLVTIDLGPFQLSPGVLVISLVVGLLVPLLAALIPLWKGTSISVREAIATYGISMGSARRTTTGGSRVTWIPQTFWLGLRGIFRKPVRAWLTLLALALSAVVFLSVQVTTDSVNYTVNESMTSYSYNLSISLGGSTLTLQQFRKLVQSVPNIRTIEPTNTGIMKTASSELALTGLEADTQLYHYRLVAGRWLMNGEQNTLVLSDVAAQKLNIRVGDSLAAQTNGSYQAKWRIVGIVHELANVQGDFIGSAFTTFENLNTIIYHQQTDRSVAFLLEGQDQTPAAIDQLENQLSTTLNNAQVQADITNRLQNFQQVQQTIQFVYVLFYTVTIAVALVGLLGLFNTLSTSVIERRLEIGILRSIGATARRVASVFWIEGLGLASIAFFIGLLLGIPGAYALVRLISSSTVLLDFSFNPGSALMTVVFVLALTFLASVGPVFTISRMRIHQILRYE